MQFTINSKSFFLALSAVGRVVPAKSPLQILTNFLIEVKEGEVAITASDTENRASATVQAITDNTGAFCIEAKFLTDIMRSLPDCPVTVDISAAGEMTITTSKNTFSAVTQASSVYPLDNFDETASVAFTMQTDTLLAGFADTSVAVGTDDFHPQMMGVNMDVATDKVTFVATDTRRLIKSEFGERTSVEGSCIISLKAITALNALASKSSSVGVKICPTAICFVGDGFTLRSQLIKGSFPNYNRVIPQNNSIRATFNRANLLAAVRRVAACADSQYGALRFKFSLDSLEVSSNDEAFNRSAKETVDCDFGGQTMLIGLSSDLLASLLSTVQTEKVTFSMADSSRPVVITADGDERLTMLLMPMNVHE